MPYMHNVQLSYKFYWRLPQKMIFIHISYFSCMMQQQ